MNLTAGDGHPVEIMGLTFAVRAMSPTVHLLPPDIDGEVARMKLDTPGMGVDALSEGQREFLSSWEGWKYGISGDVFRPPGISYSARSFRSLRRRAKSMGLSHVAHVSQRASPALALSPAAFRLSLKC